MAAEFKIGRLRFTWEGAWTPGTFYNRDAVVQYQGKTYVCLVPNTSDASNFYNDLYFVTQAGASTPYWSLILDGKTWTGAWQAGHLYSLGNIALFGGVAYYCITAHTSTAFAADAANWAEYTQFANWHTTWATGTPYGIGDVVKYGGIIYNCIANHTSALTAALGLEANQSSWAVYNNGIEYKGSWTSGYRYKLNDLAKNGPDMWICTAGHISGTFDPTKWTIWIPGEEFANTWSSSNSYQQGDVVIYGGYSYVNNTTNNTNNVPSLDSTDWTLLTTGYALMADWNNSTAYQIGDVVRVNGRLYEAIADNTAQNPEFGTTTVNGNTSAISITATYSATGSSGVTLKVSSTSGIVPGSIVIGTGFSLGQTVVSTDSNAGTVTINIPPDSTPNDGETLTFVGVNYLYWQVLVPGNYWTNVWINNSVYNVGDLVVWQNATYVCLQNHTASNGVLVSNRPDQDTSNTYWAMYIAHARKNAMNTYGDIETYNAGSYQAVPIGATSLVLRNTNNIPSWAKINVVPGVYYVAPNGTDRADYGVTWDQPWKTVAYAASIVGAGTYYKNSAQLIVANKNWMITEMYQWMLYQKANNISPFSSSSVFDGTKTIRDAGYIIDALVYDLTRNGNSQMVAATLAYFALGSTSTFFSTAIQSEMPYFIAALNQLSTLIFQVITNTVPTATLGGTLYTGSVYQQVNGVAANSIVQQYINNSITVESGANAAINSLYSILTTALSTTSTLLVPTQNSGETATIFVKTGTYAEILPITIPENVALVGDELRGVVISPATSITMTATASNATTNLFTVNSTAGLVDQMPVQFVDPTIATNITYTPFGGITVGQTYYVIGSTITSTSFGITSTQTGTVTGTIAQGNAVITNISNTLPLSVGLNISGNGIPTGATITAVGTNSITISAAATANTAFLTITYSGTQVALTAFVGGNMEVYAGDCLKNMFLMRNGSGLRNMTLTGLQGTLGAQDSNMIQRPTGSAFTSLDPGTGPNDTTAWIIRRSPYVQNVTAFGNGCAALKIDGTLHNGGNKSMVANDYTHIVNDGIGVWCTGPGALTEVISVFSYYGYTGYFAEAGGRIRAANGNTSYGQYGCIAEGYDVTETPATGVVYNQSTQVQASVQSAFGSTSQLLRLNFANAGSGYTTTTTNMLNYSNNFLGGSWSSDGNILFSKNFIAPTGLSEGWTLTGTTAGPDGSYIYQNIAVSAAGASYSNLIAVNVSGSGSGATFNVTVTSTGYNVTVSNGGGSGYVAGNQLYIAGGQLGGINSVNDCVITVASLSGSAVLTVTSSGTVPAGSAQNYTLSTYVYAGTASNIDIYGIFSGSSTVTSSLSYNFATNTLTPSSANGGFLPTNYGVITTLSSGWYRIWMAINDTTGLNTQLQFRIYPRGYSGQSGQYSYIYGAQAEISSSSYKPSFYLEVAGTSKYTAYANYNITGAGTGVVTVGEEIRSNSVFQSRVTDPGSGAGGSGYLTASNNAQAGTSAYIQLAQSDNNTSGNYIGMRVFINSGTGAGQYGYISTFDPSTKIAQVLKESFNAITVTGTASSGGVMTVGSSNDTTSLYQNQPVQFIPTYYTVSITNASLAQVAVTVATGGTINTLTVASTIGMTVNMPITFSGTTFSSVVSGYTYYVYAILDARTIQITNQLYGNVWTLTTGTGNMTMNFSSNTSYLSGSTGTTTNMVVNYPIQFTGSSFGGLTVGTVYYINDVIDTSNFTISGSLVTVSVTATNSSTNGLTVLSTTNLIPLNPIIFTSPTIGGIVDSTKYYIAQIIDGQTFSVSTSLITTVASATANTTNLITVASTSGFIPNNPINFVGTTFGGIISETIYYILAVNNSTTFTISQTPGGGAVSLATATGSVTVRTSPTPVTLTSATGTMSGTTTSKKTALSLGSGTMNATFSTQLFGGVVLGTTYYINSIPSSTTFTVSAVSGSGTPITLTSKTGSMNMAAVGWDHINVGTPILSILDSSSLYYIEPRSAYTDPAFSQVTATSTVTLANGTSWVSMAYGNNRWMALPSANSTAAYSLDGSTWTSIALPTSASWTGIAYGNNYWVAISTGGLTNSTAIVSNSNGMGWKTTTLPAAAAYSSIAYGNGTFVAVANGSNTAAYSTNYGSSWTASTLPSAASWTSVAYGGGRFVAISNGVTYTNLTQSSTSGSGSSATFNVTVRPSGYTVTLNAVGSNYLANDTVTILGTRLGGTSPTNDLTITISSVTASMPTGGVSTFTSSGIAVATTATVAAYSTNGTTWSASTLPVSGMWSNITYGNNQFMAVSNSGTSAAYSFDGITWYTSYQPVTADKVAYGQGVFVAVSASSSTGYTSEGGSVWKTRTINNDGYGCIAFGFDANNIGKFVTLAGTNVGDIISAGCRTKGRPIITSGVLTAFSEWEPGSGYTSTPIVTFTDPNVTSLATVTPRISNGVLSSPTFINRGSGYSTNSTSVIITGNGYADTYQTGLTITLNNLTRLPSPGDNLTITGVSQIYKVTSAVSVYGTSVPNLEANVSISPAMSIANSPPNNTSVAIRSKYSQCRLTNHDFLNIGYGDQAESNYPGFPESGYVATSQNQTIEVNYGRVFVTSTDQDGNFKVGNLFGVQQATGIVTLSASQFGLSGLSTLSLGGIAVGGSSVVVTQFSTDATFTANSDTVIPTQKAIKAYLTGRLSQGGANTFTGQIIAGTVLIGGANKIASSIPNGTTGSNVKMVSKVNIAGANAGVDGNMMALDFFVRSWNHR